MKIKVTFLLLSLSLAALSVSAKELDPQQALNRLNSDTSGLKTRSAEVDPNLVYTLNDNNNHAALYVFDQPYSQGYMILSADDSAAPLLGYSDSENFNPDNIPPQLKYWLGEYARQIEFMRANSYPAYQNVSTSAFKDMTPIEPLVKSKWNQGAPYNKYCYMISSNGDETKSVTGCVATSMAQVMYYFQYPSIGKGEISYKHGDSGTYSMNFASQPFQWSEMLPTYTPDGYNDTQGDAVAYLMKACGYSVKMNYGKGEAGASGNAIAGALMNYFGYDENIELQTRKFWTYDEWASMIYKNLSEIGPVIFNGSALDGGHSFICDGYDSNGYFHFNWGWGGMSDGYYLLDALNPDEYGIGGAAGGFNLGQQIILSITPKQSDIFPRQVMQSGAVTGKINGSTLTLELSHADDPGFQYIDPLPITITFGVEIQNTSTQNQDIQYVESANKNLDASEGSFFRWSEVGTSINLNDIEMTDGDQYDFIIASKITVDNNSSWSEVVPFPGKSNKVSIIKKADSYEIINYPIAILSISDFKVDSSPVYQNMPIKFSATFTNNYDTQLTRNFSAELYDSNNVLCYKMENYSITVDANSSINDTWTSVQWYNKDMVADLKEATEFTLKLYDNWEGTYVEGVETSVTVMPDPSKPKVETSLSIIGAEKVGDIYVLNSTDFEVDLTVKVLEGDFNRTVMLGIQTPLSDGDYYTTWHEHFDAIPDLSAGEQQLLTMNVSFEDAQPNIIYRVVAMGNESGFGEYLKVKFNISEDGINSISADNNGLYHIFSISGSEIMKTSDKEIIHTLPRGIYIVNGEKIAI